MSFLEWLQLTGKILWKQLSLVSDKDVISLSHAKVFYVFSDSVLCCGKMNGNPRANTAREEILGWFKDSPQYRTLDTIDGEPMEFEWNIFPGFTTLQLCYEVQEFMSKIAKSQKNSQDGSSSCRCSTTSHGDLKTMNRNANQAPISVLSVREDFHQEDGNSWDLDQKRSGILLMIANHNGTELQN